MNAVTDRFISGFFYIFETAEWPQWDALGHTTLDCGGIKN